jgi:uncharacterized membrane protein
MVQNATRDPWPGPTRVLIGVLVVLAVVAVAPWIFMGVAMASWCAPMMGGMHMPEMPMMH